MMKNTNIMIVEDEAVVARDLEGTLGAMGYSVSGVADNGNAALALAEETQPDLVLMDIRLKGELDGIATAEIMQEKHMAPVIYLTAYTDDDTASRARKTQPYGYLLKPFDDKSLQITVSNALFKYQHDLATAQHVAECNVARKNSAIVAKNVENNLLGALHAETEQRKWLERELDSLVDSLDSATSHARLDLINRLSHDIRIPLHSIIGFSQILLYNEQERLSGAQRGHVNQALEAGLDLHHLLNQLTDLSRIDTGQLKLMTLNEVSVSEILSEVIDRASRDASKRNITVHNSANTCHNARISTDPVRLMQVLANLLSGVVAFNLEGSAITVSCQYTRPGTLRINVTDTGPVIPKKQRGQIFAPLTEPGDYNSATRRLGVGLVVAKELITLMGGKIGVDNSASGGGNTFWVELKPEGLPPGRYN